MTNIRHALRSFVCVLLCACSADATAPEPNDPSESEDALFLSMPCTFREGTANYDGIEGSYERVGPNRRDEIREITISQLAADGREAHYRRRMTRACWSAGCDEDEGTMSLLADNAAFTNNFAFYPAGATSPADMVFVLGIRRDASGVVTEMCVARVVTARDVRTPFALRRVP